MPRYRFSITDGRSFEEGHPMVLADTTAARIEAIRIIGAMLRDEADRVTPHRPLIVKAIDDSGMVAARVALSVFDAGALKGQRRRPAG